MSSDTTDLLFQFKTSSIECFPSLGEALKEILTDANIVFLPSGVKICAMDASDGISSFKIRC